MKGEIDLGKLRCEGNLRREEEGKFGEDMVYERRVYFNVKKKKEKVKKRKLSYIIKIQ